MKRLALCILAVLAFVAPKLGLAQTSSACPSEGLFVRSSVLTHIGDDRVRRDFGLTAVDTTHLRLLVDPGDTSVCQQFRSTVNYSPTWTDAQFAWSYYTADGFYFVAGVPTRAGAGYGVLFIFGSSFNRKAAILL